MGSTFTDLQTRDTTYTVSALDRSGMSCEVTSTANNGKYTLVTSYLIDRPATASLSCTRLKPVESDMTTCSCTSATTRR